MSIARRVPRRLQTVNTVLAALLIGLLLAYLIVSLTVQRPPYDYWLLMHGAEVFCFDQSHFSYGLGLHAYYPAPFYTTFCLPYRYAGPLLLAVWMLAPAALALWLAKGRAGVLTYAPLGVLLLLGQSSWLLLPMYVLAAREPSRRPTVVPWWHGLLMLPGLFKPHLALPAWLVLAYRWWKQRRWLPLVVWFVGTLVLVVPSFVIRPGWPLEWLRNGRGFEPVSLASIALIPVQLGDLGTGQTAADLASKPPVTALQLAAVYGFCFVAGVVLYVLLRRRGRLDLYDWVLLFFFINPVVNDYDLIMLLPFVTADRRRLFVALVAGAASWLFAMMTLRWSLSILITLALIALRLWRGGEPQAVSARIA